MAIESRGCLASHLCNQTESGSVLTLSYTMTKTCCNTDFCNWASSVRRRPGGHLDYLEPLKLNAGRRNKMFDCLMLFFFWFQVAFLLSDVWYDWRPSSRSDTPHSLGGKYRVRRLHRGWAGGCHSFVPISQDLHLFFSFLCFNCIIKTHKLKCTMNTRKPLCGLLPLFWSHLSKKKSINSMKPSNVWWSIHFECNTLSKLS